MIAELAAGLGAVGAVTGWIFAFRARGESRAALAEANRANELKSDAIAEMLHERRRRELAEADRDTATAAQKSAEAATATIRATLAAERKAKAEFLANLAKSGAPVGPVLVDNVLDRLYPDDHENGRGPDDDHADDRDRPMPDVAP